MALGPLTHQPTVALSADDIAFFRENGFLRIQQISAPDEIAMMREAYDRIFAQRAGREEGNQFDLAGSDEEGREAALPQILGPEKYAPELWDTLARANALQICRQLLGDDIQAQGSHAIFKPAHHGAPTPWHQDEAYWNPDMEYRSLSVWLPLQDVDVENGCMQFIPGSHKWEVINHQPINNDPRIHGLELTPEVQNLAANPVICPLLAGGATFHPGRTLHHAAANHSPRPRRALVMGFGAPARPRQALALPSRRFIWNEIKKPAREERAAKAQAKANV